MRTITLPDELDLPNTNAIEVFDYTSCEEISKQQITLNKNTISFLQDGTKEVFFDNSFYSITNSQFLVMKSGHCLMTEKLSSSQDNYRSILLFFANDTIHKFIRKYKITVEVSKPLYSTYQFTYNPFLKRFVDSLIDISKLSYSVQKNMLEVKFEEVMLYLLELKGANFLFSLINNNEPDIQIFIRTIESNQLNKLTIKELSFLCNMSVSKFKRAFEKHYNESPIKWFQDKRLEHAAYLLKSKKRRPSEIYDQIGYENLSNFIHAFKTKYGITPKQYQLE